MNNLKRRSVLKIGSTLPVWSMPFVSVVLLPAHAQTSSAALVDVTLPPPGLRACEMNDTATIETAGAMLQNVGSSSLAINSISVTADLGDSIWSADTSLPATLAVDETITITFTASPIFSCTSNQNPRLTVEYQTSAGDFTFIHGT